MIHSDILSTNRLYNYHLYELVLQPEETGAELFKKIVNEMYWEYLLSNDFAKEKNTEWFTTFSAFKNHLEKHFAETRNAKDYAKMMGISYKHLNAVCKSITGSTAKACIDQFIILEAKRRLAISDISIKELTYTLGFDEPTNFVKFFKKHTLKSTSQFKKNLTK